MARIRTIKPEFPQSESIGALSRDARLLFVQLWTLADDAGRLRGSSRMLASLLYPYDDDVPSLIGAWLDELTDKECIRRYEVDGAQYVEIINWLKHQKIDRPSPSRIPEYIEGSTPPREPSRALDADLGPVPSTLDLDRDRAPSAPASEGAFEEFWKVYPKREGSNPKEPAKQKFTAAVKSGADPGEIIAAAGRYAAECVRLKIARTEKVAQAVTWLNQKRWGDYPPASAAAPQETDWAATVERYQKFGTWPRGIGNDPESTSCQAPPEILQRFGYAKQSETQAA